MKRFLFLIVLLPLIWNSLGQEPIQLPKVNADTLAVVEFPTAGTPLNAFAPGEVLHYTFRYGILRAVEATVELKSATSWEHGERWHVDARGKSTGTFSWFFKVNDHYQTTFDVGTMLPLHFIRDIEEGGYRIHQDYQFDWNTQSVRTVSSKKSQPERVNEYALPAASHDMISSLYALRNVRFDTLAMGDTLRVPLFMDEEWLELKAVYAGEKTARVKGVKWDCLLFHPVIQTGRIWRNPDDLDVYISNDDNRIPVLAETRILFGNVRMELTHVEGLRNLPARRE